MNNNNLPSEMVLFLKNSNLQIIKKKTHKAYFLFEKLHLPGNEYSCASPLVNGIAVTDADDIKNLSVDIPSELYCIGFTANTLFLIFIIGH